MVRAWFEGNEVDLAIFFTLGMGRLMRVYSIALGFVSFCSDGLGDVLLWRVINNGPAWLSLVSNTVK